MTRLLMTRHRPTQLLRLARGTAAVVGLGGVRPAGRGQKLRVQASTSLLTTQKATQISRCSAKTTLRLQMMGMTTAITWAVEEVVVEGVGANGDVPAEEDAEEAVLLKEGALLAAAVQNAAVAVPRPCPQAPPVQQQQEQQQLASSSTAIASWRRHGTQVRENTPRYLSYPSTKP